MKYPLCSLLGCLQISKKKSLQLIQFPELPEDICNQLSLAEIKAATNKFHYLHTGAKRPVIHCQIKSSNNEFSFNLSGFGLSKMFPHRMPKELMRIMSFRLGTWGYVASEHMFSGELTEKSDVFSFGVILFEVLCGREVHDWSESSHHIVDFLREGTIYQVIDPYLKGRIASECFKKYLEIACACVRCDRNERPEMGEVEVTLELVLELQKKADSEMEAIHHHGEFMYEEASFFASDSDFDSDFLLRPYRIQNR